MSGRFCDFTSSDPLPAAERSKATIRCIRLRENRPQVRERTEEDGTPHYGTRLFALLRLTIGLHL